MSLTINSQLIAENISVGNDYNNWTDLDVPIPADILKPENNLFKFIFSEANNDKNNFLVSATLKSIILN